MKTALTGIKPTGTPHLGNYLGAIRPALSLVESFRSFYFIADYHALTTVHEPSALRTYVYDVAATWLACGLDPSRTCLFLQSAVPEVFELMWIFECFVATGQLERGHAYKDAVTRGEAPNAGIFNYPVLMAADIILYGTDVVPVGRDQKQHVELARDVAIRLNHHYGEGTVVVPEPLIKDEVQVPGVDGQKMSKSYGNVIPLFGSAKELRAAVMRIKTGSEPLAASKEPETSIVYKLYCAVAPSTQAAEMAARLREGGYGWGHAKEALYEALEADLSSKRVLYETWRANERQLDSVLAQGADTARTVAKETLHRVRRAIGIAR